MESLLVLLPDRLRDRAELLIHGLILIFGLAMAYNGGSIGGVIFSPLWVAAIGALGFPLAARRSELVALDVSDIEECPEGLRVRIRKSKTDQERAGATIAVCRGSMIGGS